MTQTGYAGFGRHGGRLDEAVARYPTAPQPWLDLSTGINPHLWSPPEGLVVDPAPLPATSALADLERAAARHFGVDPSRVAAVPGSEIALRLLGAIGLPRPIVALHPSYGTHGEAADERIDVPLLVEQARAPGTILLANPNNPDGRVIDPAQLRRLAADRHDWLVIDEAFADATPETSIFPHLDGTEPVLVLRSFGKFFGLAGVRLGFAIAPPAIIARWRALLGDWPVSAHAIAWGTAAYADDEWIARTRTALAEQAAAFDAVLARHGLAAQGACPLFRLVEHPDAPAIFERLAQVGILTRPFADRRDWLRFGVPGDAVALARLERALADG
jgi:cobalamin biosynthetic protein CobC